MPRTYIKGNNKRHYGTYSEEDMQKAIKSVKEGKSISSAAKEFCIERSTLSRHCSGVHCDAVGRPPVLTSEEKLLVDMLKQLADWGFGLDSEEVRCFIKRYLDNSGRIEPRFQNNLPGRDFVYSFMKRNNLSKRSAGNIKASRAKLDEDIVRSFFQNLDSTRDIDSANVFNYDETAISDNPGQKKVVVPRGTKRVELVREHSKVNVSVMVCGSASGELLPPMVCYRAEHLYQYWTTGGPHGAAYTATKSGWFDMNAFEVWFKSIFIEAMKNRPGRKLLIGDNLSSHFSPEVIRLAASNDIYFTCLPPNATHLLQPLDVAFFRPAKMEWKKILDNYRRETRVKSTIPKDTFPVMLYKLWQQIHKNSAQNLKSGFRATGIYPRNVEEPLKRLPGTVAAESLSVTRRLDETLLQWLKEQRGHSRTQKNKGRGPKVSPGVALSTENVPGPSTSTNERSAEGATGASVTSTESSEEEDDEQERCGECSRPWIGYRGEDWLECCACKIWICGYCNDQDLYFLCAACRATS